MIADKVTVGSPDGLGDFVLRLPLVESLIGAGCRLQLAMRPPAADLAQDLFPETEVLVLERDPFHAETKKQKRPFRHELEQIRRFGPGLYVASAFQPNFFDEALLRELGGVLPCAGFSADEEFWPSDTASDPRELAEKFSIRVGVPTAMPETEKGLRLAAAVTGSAPVRSAPRPPSRRAVEEARAVLGKYGLHENGYTVVCAGSRPGLAMKDWGEANWIRLMREIGDTGSAPFVFLGNPKEAPSVARLCQAAGTGAHTVNLSAEPPPVAVSYALVSMASAYLGRDSGIMHLAAAAGIPLAAVFAGGHWPRFVPDAQRGVVITRKAPCRGCNFYCPFPEPWCVKTVPVEAVAEAWRELAKTKSLRVVELDADEQWLAMARETDAPSYAREQALAARESVGELENEGLWRRLLGGFVSR